MRSSAGPMGISAVGVCIVCNIAERLATTSRKRNSSVQLASRSYISRWSAIQGREQRTAMMFRRIGGHTLRCAGCNRPAARRKLPNRRFSAYTTSSNTPASSTASSPLGSVSVELDRIAPRFEVPASQITILDSPASFYGTLKVRSARG